jgi:glycosyltransferase involved in cell wall biosynthesis
MSGDIPLVSVIIPTFNAGRFVNATIESALRQTLANLEIIVSDDGSTDDTVRRVKSVRDPRVRLFEYPHCGAPGMMNRGIDAARGRYLGFLDHDDLWLPAKLERHIEFLEHHSAVGVTFSWSGLIDNQDRRLDVPQRRWCGPLSFSQLLEDYVVGSTSSLVMRRSTVENAGGFDEQFPCYHDVDLLLRIALAQPMSICAIPEELTLYRRHAGQMSRDWRAMQADWNSLIDKWRRLAPDLTAAVESRARSNTNRYFAFLAYEQCEFSVALCFVWEALRRAPLAFLADVRNWKATAACLSSVLLPSTIHRGLEQLAGIQRQ